MKSSTSSDFKKYCPSGLALRVDSRANRMLDPEQMSSQFELVKQEHYLDLFYSTRLTHAHWSTASRFLLDVCSDRFGQIFWADAQLG